jgi:hypothetical protein
MLDAATAKIVIANSGEIFRMLQCHTESHLQTSEKVYRQ